MQRTTVTDGLSAIVFDIGGTLLNSADGTRAEFQRVLRSATDEDTISRIADEVTAQMNQRMGRMSRGEEPFSLETDLLRHALPQVLQQHRVSATPAQIDQLVTVGERFDAFPEAPRQLAQLVEHTMVVGLTNSALDQVSKASARTGLQWHALLGSQFAHTYKPDPKAYALVADLLHIDPAEALFVAAHPWDLRGAAKAGFRTVYLPRPHTDDLDEADHFDLMLDSLDELAALWSES
ncbi:MAG: HAD-IA family hydrolase [Leucobacter sp.]